MIEGSNLATPAVNETGAFWQVVSKPLEQINIKDLPKTRRIKSFDIKFCYQVQDLALNRLSDSKERSEQKHCYTLAAIRGCEFGVMLFPAGTEFEKYRLRSRKCFSNK